MSSHDKTLNRREFIKTATAASAAAAAMAPGRSVFAQGSDKIRIALIGCGGRGRGAIKNNLAGCENTELAVVADAFQGKAEAAAREHNLPPERTFWGLDAYKKALASDIDMVILATPPGFRPLHYAAAIEAGKHVFMEKPCCVDAPGYRKLLAANKMADAKGLKVGVGLQRRHDASWVNGINAIHDGKYGDLILLQAYWNGGGIWWREAQPGWSEMQKQCNNWYHFLWLSGDNICEQHIHNLDVCNWAKGAHPIAANGMGGSEVRRANFKETQIFDHHFVEFTYPDGTKMYSQCRHAPKCFNRVGEYAFGSKGNGPTTQKGPLSFQFGAMEQEHHDLVDAIRNNKTYNEGHYGATSSFTAVLGRMATYSGNIVKWDEAAEKGKELAPGLESYTMDSTPPAQMGADGAYPIAMPGKYNPFA